MATLNLKPNHKPVKDYYAALDAFSKHGITHETAVRNAFQQLLTYCSRKVGWQFIEERQWTPPGTSRTLFVDGVMEDKYTLPRAWWEAKDEQDDLAKEAKKKFEIGYPDENIIFQSPARAILYQKKRKILDEDITSPKMLVDVIHELFHYREEWLVDWETAAEDFKGRIPQYADALMKLIERERKDNTEFIERFGDFAELCKATINPNLRDEAIEEMLIQHMLTKRIFTTVFSNTAFTRRNPVAREITGVVDALTSRSFSEAEFFSGLERFYKAIERGAENISEYATKQHFLNNVYERFFQGFSVKVADTHGIVYTPQPIVDFMVRSVDEILKKEFGKKEGLGAKGVHILDPFVGTGNFMMRVMREIPKTQLEYKYAHELHCNEVMLLPYYIASMNIEHEYYELTGSYRPFEGICLVDTFELAEPDQGELFTAENTERVKKLKETPLFVILGNPPYNAGQLNENDNNKNRKYTTIDQRVTDTYKKDSNAGLTVSLNDPYVKAYRWASDQVIKNGEGIVAFVSNNNFVDEYAFDGMREHLYKDYDDIYIINLRGNVRKNPKIAGTTHNVFGIQVGVSINILIKRKDGNGESTIYYADTDEFWRKAQRYYFLSSASSLSNVGWRTLTPDRRHTWLTDGIDNSFSALVPLGSKETKQKENDTSIFRSYSNGIKSNRDVWVFNFQRDELQKNVLLSMDEYNIWVTRWTLKREPVADIDDFIIIDDQKLKWSGDLKQALQKGEFAKYSEENIRLSTYRPFTKCYYYFDRLFNNSIYQFPHIYPTFNSEKENPAFVLPGVGNRKAFGVFTVNHIVSLDFAFEKTQCFPFYTYDEDGSNRKENITDWALAEYRKRYSPLGEGGTQGGSANNSSSAEDASAPDAEDGEIPGQARNDVSNQITKWDIFHYIYGILHSPEYREKYAANLRRELPRIPYVKTPEDFRAFSEAGKRLAWLHLNYDNENPLPEDSGVGAGLAPPANDADVNNVSGAASSAPTDPIPEYPLDHIENPNAALDWRVEKMRWKDRATKTTLIYNDFLTLSGIPPEAHRYKLGNRSALDWIVDQYRIKTDKRSGITNDPNRPDDPQYIVRLIKKVTTVSLRTMEIVDRLPSLDVEEGTGMDVEEG